MCYFDASAIINSNREFYLLYRDQLILYHEIYTHTDMSYICILDYGHGLQTPGKRSPDSSLYEWQFNRELGKLIKAGLEEAGIVVRETLSPESDSDPSLSVRADRANHIAADNKDSECIFVSIHGNAAGNGQDWSSARGWSVFVSPNSSSHSKALACALTEGADKAGLKIRRPRPGQDYWESNFAVLRRTTMPAVLTENLFYDNKEDCEIMKSPEGLNKLATAHIYGITEYFRALEQK